MEGTAHFGARGGLRAKLSNATAKACHRLDKAEAEAEERTSVEESPVSTVGREAATRYRDNMATLGIADNGAVGRELLATNDREGRVLAAEASQEEIRKEGVLLLEQTAEARWDDPLGRVSQLSATLKAGLGGITMFQGVSVRARARIAAGRERCGCVVRGSVNGALARYCGAHRRQGRC